MRSVDPKKDAAIIKAQLQDFGYKTLNVLGQGSWGQVMKCQDLTTNTIVAVKTLKKKGLSQDSWNKIALEYEAMVNLEHPSIIKLLKMHESTDYIYYVLEFCAEGDLLQYIYKKQQLTETEARVIIKQLASGLAYAYKEGYCHRDIKLENIFLAAEGSVRLGDWGFARKYRVPEKTKESCGSLHYAPPEVVSAELYRGPEIDVWSLGVTLYILVSGTMPFFGPDDQTIISRIKANTYPPCTFFSPELKQLISQMLESNPEKRLLMEEVLKHPWVTKDDIKAKPYIPSLDFKDCQKFTNSGPDTPSSQRIQRTKRLTEDIVNSANPAKKGADVAKQIPAQTQITPATQPPTQTAKNEKQKEPENKSKGKEEEEVLSPRSMLQIAANLSKDVPVKERTKREKFSYFFKTLLSGSKIQRDKAKQLKEEEKQKQAYRASVKYTGSPLVQNAPKAHNSGSF